MMAGEHVRRQSKLVVRLDGQLERGEGYSLLMLSC